MSELWRAITESAVDGIVFIGQHGSIESFNPAAERMFGYSRDEVIGRNVSMLMPEPYASEHDGYLERYARTRERRIIGLGREVIARRKDGTVFPVHLAIGELTLDGVTRFTGIVRDLTECKRLEVKLREEAGLVPIGELAAVLAHEVKNPLAAVSGAIQMLREHLCSEEDQDVVREVLQRLDSLGELMTDLVFARPVGPTTAVAQPHQVPPSRLSVLVVDDEPLIRWALSKGLSKRGHTVVEAKTASETLAAIGANPDRFAIVILDYRLPDRQDLTLLQEVRRMTPGSAVWMMTAYGDAEMRAQALVLGARAIIDKPFQINDIVSLVESVGI